MLNLINHYAKSLCQTSQKSFLKAEYEFTKMHSWWKVIGYIVEPKKPALASCNKQKYYAFVKEINANIISRDKKESKNI